MEYYNIESRNDADEYLSSLFERDDYPSLIEVQIRAHKYISDESIRYYFLSRAKELLS